MIRHETYENYPEALDKLVQTLKARSFSPTEYHIVLTPDRYTLKIENALFLGSGAIDLEVLTLSRLCRRILGGDVLTKEGGVMLTARAIENVADSLVYYGRAAAFSDFAREAYETIMQIESSDADFDALISAADGATRQKLSDLKLIYDEYEKLKEGVPDSPDRLKALLSSAASSPLVKNSHFYAIGYADCTKLNTAVFEAISEAAKSFTMFDAERPKDERVDGIVVYRAPDAVTQYKAVASRIREYVYKGGSYGDVAVICPEPSTLSRILREYEIDFHYDNSTPLDLTPLVTALSDVYEISRGEGDSRRLVALCKNPYSGCDADDAQALSRYLTSRGIEYGVLSKDIADEGAARAAAHVKKIVGAFSGKSFCDGVTAVLQAVNAEQMQKRISDAFKSDAGDDDLVFTDTCSPVMSLLGLLKKYGNGDVDTDAKSFFSAAHAVEVKSLPRYTDRVTVCNPETLRLDRCKMLFVTDLNEGVLPAVTPDGGLITDGEIRATGSSIEPTVREKNKRSRLELVAVMQNAENVFCTYSTQELKRASFLSAVAEGVDELDYKEEVAALKKTSDVAFISRFACVKNAARELAARNMTSYGDALKKAAGEGRTAAKFKETAAGIKLDSISVSELNAWFDCPYKRFLSYSVGLSRRSHGFDAPNFGTALHEFMLAFVDKYKKTGVLDDTYDFAYEVIGNALDGLGIELESKDLERIARDACDYASLNKRVIEAGDYTPEEAEREFFGDILLGKSKTPFHGYIDRVDAVGQKARVIDYKTGGRRFDISECKNGRDMQLPLYAAELKAKGADVTGMFYMPLQPRYDGDGALLSGVLVKDEQTAEEYDRGIISGEKSEIISARLLPDGCFDGRLKKQLLDKESFDALIDGCVSTASLAVDEIGSGYIERAPADGACERCAFGGLCDGKKPRSDRSEDEE